MLTRRSQAQEVDMCADLLKHPLVSAGHIWEGRLQPISLLSGIWAT